MCYRASDGFGLDVSVADISTLFWLTFAFKDKIIFYIESKLKYSNIIQGTLIVM